MFVSSFAPTVAARPANWSSSFNIGTPHRNHSQFRLGIQDYLRLRYERGGTKVHVPSAYVPYNCLKSQRK